MKRLNNKRFLLTLLLNIAIITAYAHDIEAVNDNGVTIYYIWTNGNTELAVSYRGSFSNSYQYEYSGDVFIPESVTYNGTFFPVTSISSGAFSGCIGLTNVIIPNSVKSIGNDAFNGCSGLISVVVGNSVENIGQRTFVDCSSLRSITVSSENSIYDSRSNCNAIIKSASNTLIVGCKNTYIPNSVTTIDSYAFAGCSSLMDVTIPNSVTAIHNSAFNGCTGLTSVTIPSSVTLIQGNVFTGCKGLTSIIVSSENSKYDSRNYCNAIIETSSNTLIVGCKNTIIPNSVTTIGYEAFEGCSGLKNVAIPNSVTDIDDFAFESCSGLASVTLPNSLTRIGNVAFGWCTNLREITIPNSVITIGGNSFRDCSSLTDVYCYAENVPNTGTSAFYNSSYKTSTLHVPSASIDNYQTTEPWSGFGNIVALTLPQCTKPTIAFANGKLTFDCETGGVEFVYTISQTGTGCEVLLTDMTPTYQVSVYAKKTGYDNSDVATMAINYQTPKGDVNGDGEITIADAVGIVDIILNSNSTTPGTKYYYSVGTEEVTADNYTIANGAQYKSSLAEIPETLDLSAISQQQAVILLPEGCLPMIRSASGLVGTTSVSLGNGYMVYTTTSAINGSECTCTVYK